MSEAELSVAITGKDTLSPALAITNQKLGETKKAMESAATEADFLRDRFLRLREQHNLGVISASQYASELKTLRADMAALANTTTLGAESQALLARTGGQAAAQLRNVSGGMNRAIFGVQSLSMAMQGGRISTMGLTAALTTLGLGSPEFLLITAGLAAVAALLTSIDDKAESAGRSLSGFNRGRLQGIVDRLEAKQRGDGSTDPLGMAIARAGGRGGFLTPAEATELANARAELARGGRQAGGRGTGGRADQDRLFTLLNQGLEGGSAGAPRALDKLEEVFGNPHVVQGIDKSTLAIHKLRESLAQTHPVLEKFSDAFSIGVGAALDIAASGGHVFQAFTNAILTALSREARGKAVFEAAEGFAALGKGLLFGDPKALAAAGAHFKAAALYGGAAVATGALAGGGAAAPGSRPLGAPGTVGGSSGAITIIQFVTPDGRQVSQQVVETAARQNRLGASVVRVPVNAVVLGGPIAARA